MSSKRVPAQFEEGPERKDHRMHLMWGREARMEKERNDLFRLRREAETRGR
jgi:hypothetical protein